jgi:hypothetical protein
VRRRFSKEDRRPVMRQRLFIGRWLTVMSGDDPRKRIGAVNGRTLITQKVVAIVHRRILRRKTGLFVIRREVVERRSRSSSEHNVERR